MSGGRRALNPRLVIRGLWLVCLGLGLALGVVRYWPGGRGGSSPAPPTTIRGCTPADPCLALVIDDVGRDLETLRRFVDADLPLTFSLLPHARHTDRSLRLLREHKREVMLHLPMRPKDTSKVSDEPVVVGMDGPAEQATALALRRVPGAVGANNHMGSAASLDPKIINKIIKLIGSRGLWFLDSRTVSGSRICEVARPLGVPCIERDVFVDIRPSAEAIRHQLDQAASLARRRGWAVAIAHNRPHTALSVVPALGPLRALLVPLSRLFSAKSGDYRRDLGGLDAT